MADLNKAHQVAAIEGGIFFWTGQGPLCTGSGAGTESTIMVDTLLLGSH